MNPNSNESTMFNQSYHQVNPFPETFISNSVFPNSEYNFSSQPDNTFNYNHSTISAYNFSNSNSMSNISNQGLAPSKDNNEFDYTYYPHHENYPFNFESGNLISQPNSPQLNQPSSQLINSTLDTVSSSEESSSHELESEKTAIDDKGKSQSPASDLKEGNPKPRDQSKGGASVNRPSLKKPKRERGAKLAIRIETDVDVLDDGYKWRKYGQKPVKNSPYPRSYYKCTDKQCKVKKHVERQSHEPAYVVMTYEDVHNHPRPDQQLQALQQTQNIISSYQEPFATYFDQLHNRQSVANSNYLHPSISQYKPGYVLNNRQHSSSNVSNIQYTSSLGLLEDIFHGE